MVEAGLIQALKSWLVWTAVAGVLAGTALFTGFKLLDSWAHQPRADLDENMTPVVVEVPTGMPLSALAERLQTAGAVDNALLFSIYSRMNDNSRTIKAGRYLFPRSVSPTDILQRLSEGPTAAEWNAAAQLQRWYVEVKTEDPATVTLQKKLLAALQTNYFERGALSWQSGRLISATGQTVNHPPVEFYPIEMLDKQDNKTPPAQPYIWEVQLNRDDEGIYRAQFAAFSPPQGCYGVVIQLREDCDAWMRRYNPGVFELGKREGVALERLIDLTTSLPFK